MLENNNGPDHGSETDHIELDATGNPVVPEEPKDGAIAIGDDDRNLIEATEYVSPATLVDIGSDHMGLDLFPLLDERHRGLQPGQHVMLAFQDCKTYPWRKWIVKVLIEDAKSDGEYIGTISGRDVADAGVKQGQVVEFNAEDVLSVVGLDYEQQANDPDEIDTDVIGVTLPEVRNSKWLISEIGQPIVFVGQAMCVDDLLKFGEKLIGSMVKEEYLYNSDLQYASLRQARIGFFESVFKNPDVVEHCLIFRCLDCGEYMWQWGWSHN